MPKNLVVCETTGPHPRSLAGWLNIMSGLDLVATWSCGQADGPADWWCKTCVWCRGQPPPRVIHTAIYGVKGVTNFPRTLYIPVFHHIALNPTPGKLFLRADV